MTSPTITEQIALLDKVRTQVLASPYHFDMRYWTRYEECGTVHCIGGWAVALSGEEILSDSRTEDSAESLLPDFKEFFFGPSPVAYLWLKHKLYAAGADTYIEVIKNWWMDYKAHLIYYSGSDKDKLKQLSSATSASSDYFAYGCIDEQGEYLIQDSPQYTNIVSNIVRELGL